MKNFIYLLVFITTAVHGQNTFKAKIIDAETNGPLYGATVQISPTQGAIADTLGYVQIDNIIADSIIVKASYVGYQTFTKTYFFPLNEIQVIKLEHDEDMESVIVTSTRTGRTINDIPTRIEVIGGEELEEKSMMRSSNIAMLLRESTGIQMQITSASSANQSIRIQGLDGRYTQILKDGFPVFGGFAGGLSIMQVPPLDLRQVEVLKGSNSTLYGGGAIAGLVNLVTITPDEHDRKLKFMLDQSGAGGTTLNSFYAEKYNRIGITFYTSINRQQTYDSNNDDFSDIPQIRSITLNPSFFYYFNDQSNLRLSLNGTFENRLGGDIQVIENDVLGIHQFTEENQSDRLSYQLTYTNQLSDNKTLTLKNSLTYFDRAIGEPNFSFNGKQWSSFTELSYVFGEHTSKWITGLNLYTDSFNENSPNVITRDYSYTTLGAFGQNTTDLTSSLSLESGLRFDYDFDFGVFALPRISLLKKFNEKWSSRIGGGLGYKLPTIFTEEAETLTFQNIQPIDEDLVDAERSIGGNIDVNFKTALGSDWTLSINQLFFYTELKDAVVFRQNNIASYFYENADGTVESKGLETNLKLTYKDFKLFANYALIDTRLRYDNLNQQKTLTPKHNLGAVLVYEQHGKWRVGLESYYTGRQFRSDRSETDDFWIVGFMFMRKWDKIALYFNFENFTDTRQHKLEAFNVGDHFKPQFPEIWAPTDGFIINGGIIIEF